MAFGDKTRDRIQRKKAGLQALLLNWGGKMEGYAKEHAPWTDRTGHARQGLKGGALPPEGDKHVLYLSHGVEYGIWLELAHGGNYAILKPTFDAHKSRIQQSLSKWWED